MIGDAGVSSGGSSDVVNGIIEQYKAQTNTIDANTFVEFVNNYDTQVGTDTTLVSESYTYHDASAVLIDTNKVFIAYCSSSNYYLNGIVCTISGTTITKETDTVLVLRDRSSSDASAVLIDTNKVFIAHHSGGSNSYLNGIVCTISGTTITKGTDTTLVSESEASSDASAVLIDTNKVFIAHKSGSSSYLNGIICTISGTTITKGKDTVLVSKIYAYEDASAVLIDTNKVFIAHGSDSSNRYLNGIICTISGTTITKGTDTTLVSESYTYHYASAVLIDTNKVFIAHSSSGSNYYLNGIVCTISGTTITKGTDTTLVSESKAYHDASAVLIDTNKVFIAHSSSDSNSYLNGIICTISGTTITKGKDTTLVSESEASSDASAVLIDTNKVFIAHRNGGSITNSYLNGIVCIEINNKNIEEAENKIDGLTKTSVTTETEGDVWVLGTEVSV